MKKLSFFLTLHVIVILSLQGQPVSDYQYKLDNGITVKTEHCWNQVWVQQSYTPVADGDQNPMAVNIRTLGELISGSAYNLQSKGKDVKMKGAAPGTYDLKLNFKLSGNPGTLSFTIRNILIKPKTKTNVAVTLYDYQIVISESPVSLNGSSSFETIINRCKDNTVQDIYFGIPTFYNAGNREKPVLPDESTGKTKGKIKSGNYDLLINLAISGHLQKIWLENFKFLSGINYKISVNLNAGGIIYSGGNKDVKSLHLYPAGTAGTQTGNPAPVKNLETISYQNVTIANCCSPGTYDVLLNIRNGAKYEWRKNIVVATGVKTEIK